MRKKNLFYRPVFVVVLILLVFVLAGCVSGIKQAGKDSKESSETAGNFTEDFSVNKEDLGPTGRNPFFVLEPGYTLVLEGQEDEEDVTVEIKVLDETKEIDGVTTRIVRETEKADDEVVEVSSNFFAIDSKTNSVFYFGEDVDNFENGKLADHEGTWRAGKDNAKFGLIMPGIQLLGARYSQEIAPGVAEDRAETLSISETLKTPAGTFNDVLKTAESTPLEQGVVENKFYAPGIGLIQDADLKLVESGFK